MTSQASLSGIILAGGQSRRMGRDKAFIEFEGAPLVSRVVERVSNLCSEVIIVTNDPNAYAQFDTRLVSDVYPGKGSLGGIFSGLQAASHNLVLAVACDMPFLNQDLIHYMISLAPEFDVVIPRAHDPSGKVARTARGDRPTKDKSRLLHGPIAKERDLHPMHAIYSKSCIDPIRDRLLVDDLRMIGFHDKVRVRIVEPDEVDRFDREHWSFFNVNTPEDLALANGLVS